MRVKISSMYCDHYKFRNIEDKYPILKNEFHITRDSDTGFTYIDIDRIDELAMLEDSTGHKISIYPTIIYSETFWLVIEDYI